MNIDEYAKKIISKYKQVFFNCSKPADKPTQNKKNA